MSFHSKLYWLARTRATSNTYGNWRISSGLAVTCIFWDSYLSKTWQCSIKMPSRLLYQSFFGPENLPPLEAFALGCPVIAANVSGAVEQLGDAAILVDPKTLEEIAGAIRTLHNDRKLFSRTGLSRAGARLARTADHFVRGVFSFSMTLRI